MKDNKYKELFDRVEIDALAKDRIEEKIYELRFKFEVGESEMHTVEFTYNRFWGYVDIKVDKKRFKKELIKTWIKQTRTYEFAIGNIEKHNVRINLVRSVFPISTKVCTAWVYVDEHIVGQFDGHLTIIGKRFRDMSIRNRRIAIISYVLIIAAAFFLIAYHLPIRISEEINGVLIRAGTSEPDYLQPVRITVEGKYYRNLYPGNHVGFEGSCKAYVRDAESDGNTDFQKESKGFSVFPGVGIIEGYIKTINSFGHSTHDGFFYLNPGTGELMIIVFENDENGGPGHAGGSDGLYYAAPCNTREEALDIINYFSPKIWGKKVTPRE